MIEFLSRSIFRRSTMPEQEAGLGTQVSKEELARRFQAGVQDIERLHAVVREGFYLPEIMGR